MLDVSKLIKKKRPKVEDENKVIITKAYIKRLPTSNSNKALVDIPFRNRGSNSITNSAYYEATICYIPGIYNYYKVGDPVFVAFEDNDYDKPVILGKLYTGQDKEVTTQFEGKSLTINETAKLPNTTTVGGRSQNRLNKTTEELEDDKRYNK